MQFAIGEHIKVRRFLMAYTHHGIYVGEGRVIHFDGEPFLGRPARIRETGLDAFLNGGRPISVRRRDPLPPSEVVLRAERALQSGFGAYRVFFRNCEHFATWCKLGRRQSWQVRRGVALGVFAIGGLASVAAFWTREPGEPR